MHRDPQVDVTTAIPCYAVVGKVNTGKSAVLATLLEEDDDRLIRISPEPGETTHCQPLSLVLDGCEYLRFIDTPGFQQPIAAMRAIQALQPVAGRAPDRTVLARFVASRQAEFVDECSLLAPLLAGAGVIYVIDPDVPLYDSFRAEIEILRWTGRPRLALLNRRSDTDAGRYEADWRAHLGSTFNLVRSFDAHRARFASRRRLLAALNQIEEAHQQHLDTTLALLDTEWQQRREQAAEAIVSCLGQAFAWRETGRYQDHGERPEQAAERLGQRYFEHIAGLERDCSQQLLTLYRHKALQAQPRANFAAALGPELDLAQRDTWRRLGLTRRQLTTVGATVGAGAGLSVDAATLGHTLGLASVIGGVSGAALAFFKGEALPELSLQVGAAHIGGGRQLTLGPPRSHNFGWVVLDSLLLRYQHILEHAHGRRDSRALAVPAMPASGRATTLPRQQKKLLARWFRQCRKGHAGDADGTVNAAIVAMLAAVERDLD